MVPWQVEHLADGLSRLSLTLDGRTLLGPPKLVAMARRMDDTAMHDSPFGNSNRPDTRTTRPPMSAGWARFTDSVGYDSVATHYQWI